jgi:REP element-mobilizing transposase RayT
MPYIQVWVHYVWATKNREPVLFEDVRYKLFDHIRENAKTKNIYLDRINGYYDHVHCLVSLGTKQTIDEIAQLLKGESSHWFNNKSGFANKSLKWQEDYFAVGVGESILNKVRAYIDGQEMHHKKKTFQEEYDEFIEKYRFEKFG